MSRDRAAIFIAAIVGTLSIILSVAGLIKGGVFSDHYFGFFCGITLVGTAYMHNMQKPPKSH